MNLLERVWDRMVGIQERSVDPLVTFPSLYDQVAAVQGVRTSPWRAASISMALGVPAIFRAVSLIANTVGALSLQAYRSGALMAAEDRPRLIVRPNPLTTPRDFFRDTAWNIATRGEAWWWVAKRDIDGSAMSLVPVPPQEVAVEENPGDLRYPIIRWRDRQYPNDDMRQITFAREPGQLRGIGPLQACGAAVSVAVEAQEWAANFFADGGVPSMVIKSAIPLSGDLDGDGLSEADRLRDQWVSKAHNVPRIIDPSIEDVSEFGTNQAGAQMLASRDYQNGEAARMFGIPGSLLDYSTPGSSLTYQNLEGEFGKWVRSGLWPNFLEGVEQEMSDLLTRSTTARFNVDALTRADAKTRYEIYELGVTKSGVLDVDEARRLEGLEPGDVERAPVPFAPPQAVPERLEARSTDAWRCASCGRLLAEARGVGTRIRCKCGHLAA